jgi:hypothetical protein
MHTYPDRIEPHLIVPHELPEDLVGKGEILLDPRGELHHRYGARSACLYVVRPEFEDLVDVHGSLAKKVGIYRGV